MPASVPIQGHFRPDQAQKIDEWRRSQPDLPTRSSAVKRLVCMALRSEAAHRQDDRVSA